MQIAMAGACNCKVTNQSLFSMLFLSLSTSRIVSFAYRLIHFWVVHLLFLGVGKPAVSLLFTIRLCNSPTAAISNKNQVSAEFRRISIFPRRPTGPAKVVAVLAPAKFPKIPYGRIELHAYHLIAYKHWELGAEVFVLFGQGCQLSWFTCRQIHISPASHSARISSCETCRDSHRLELEAKPFSGFEETQRAKNQTSSGL